MAPTTTTAPPPLARKIREARRGTELSQKKFAQRVSAHLPEGYRCTRFDLIRWEKGDEPRPLILKLKAIAAASGKTLDFFLNDEEDEEDAALRRVAEGLVAVLHEAVTRCARG